MSDDLFAVTPGWSPIVDEALRSITRTSFVSGDPTSDRIRVAWFVRDVDEAIVGRAFFGPGAEGPPRHAHGGAMAALLDEVMGFACWVRGHRVLAKSITVDFKRSLPLLPHGTVVTFEGTIESIAQKTVTSTGRLVMQNGEVCAEGRGVYVEVSASRLAKMLQG